MMKRISFCFFAILLLASVVKADDEISLADLGAHWKTDDNRDITFHDLLGSPYILTMMYTSCRSTCPITVKKLHDFYQVAEKQGIRPKFVLVSFDGSRDNPEALKAFREMHELSKEQWTLLSGDVGSIRKLAVLLGVSYQQDQDTGEFTHTNQFTFVDGRGIVTQTIVGLNGDLMPLLERFREVKNKPL